MTDEDLSTKAAVSAVEEVQANAENLDLKWGLRPAQVNDITGNAVQIILDGDTNLVPAISLIGNLAKGARVWALKIPPSGNYVVGFAGGAPLPQMGTFHGLANAPQTRNVATYADVLAIGAVSVTTIFYKYRAGSRIAYNLVTDAFATAANATVEYAFLVNGTDYSAATYFFNAATDHRTVAGASVLTGSENIPAGRYTVTLRWRSPSATAVNMNNDSQILFQLTEVAPALT